MSNEQLHIDAGSAMAHACESWAPVVVDDRTLEDWGKLPTGEPSTQEHPQDTSLRR